MTVWGAQRHDNTEDLREPAANLQLHDPIGLCRISNSRTLLFLELNPDYIFPNTFPAISGALFSVSESKGRLP